MISFLSIWCNIERKSKISKFSVINFLEIRYLKKKYNLFFTYLTFANIKNIFNIINFKFSNFIYLIKMRWGIQVLLLLSSIAFFNTNFTIRVQLIFMQRT